VRRARIPPLARVWLHDEPRSGAPRTIDDDRIEAVIVKTLESKPAGATHWSSRGMAKAAGVSTSSVQRIWRAFGLQPHRAETFKLSTDPLFVDKVRDVVGLHVAPPDRAVVLCVDEKSQIQALDRSQPLCTITDEMINELRTVIVPRGACTTHNGFGTLRRLVPADGARPEHRGAAARSTGDPNATTRSDCDASPYAGERLAARRRPE
jgi:hypothetical protein